MGKKKLSYVSTGEKLNVSPADDNSFTLTDHNSSHTYMVISPQKQRGLQKRGNLNLQNSNFDRNYQSDNTSNIPVMQSMKSLRLQDASFDQSESRSQVSNKENFEKLVTKKHHILNSIGGDLKMPNSYTAIMMKKKNHAYRSPDKSKNCTLNEQKRSVSKIQEIFDKVKIDSQRTSNQKIQPRPARRTQRGTYSSKSTKPRTRTPMKGSKSTQKLIKFKASTSTKKLDSPKFSYKNENEKENNNVNGYQSRDYSPKQSEQYSIEIQEEIKVVEEPITRIKKSPKKLKSPKKSQKDRSLETVGEVTELQEESNILSIRRTLNNSSVNNLTLSDLQQENEELLKLVKNQKDFIDTLTQKLVDSSISDQPQKAKNNTFNNLFDQIREKDELLAQKSEKMESLEFELKNAQNVLKSKEKQIELFKKKQLDIQGMRQRILDLEENEKKQKALIDELRNQVKHERNDRSHTPKKLTNYKFTPARNSIKSSSRSDTPTKHHHSSPNSKNGGNRAVEKGLVKSLNDEKNEEKVSDFLSKKETVINDSHDSTMNIEDAEEIRKLPLTKKTLKMASIDPKCYRYDYNDYYLNKHLGKSKSVKEVSINTNKLGRQVIVYSDGSKRLELSAGIRYVSFLQKFIFRTTPVTIQ